MSLSEPLERSWQVSAALLALRVAIGWHFFYEGISKLLAPGWSAERYLSTAEWLFGGLFQAIAKTPWMVDTVSALNSWGLTVIGLCLMLGVLTRGSSISGTILLFLYSLAHPAFPGMAGSSLGGGSYLFIDRNIIEALALIMIATLSPGRLWGLDRLLSRLRHKSAGETTVESSGRRELMKDLTGAPVLGAMAAAVLGSRLAEDGASEVDALSGATPVLRASTALEKSGNIVSVRDIERLASKRMAPAHWAYVSGGSGDEQTLRWNEAAYRQIHLRLRVIESQTEPDTCVRLFGRQLPHPILLAPARQADIHPEGELATVRGAGASGAVMIVSTNATKSIEDIVKAATGPVWYQAYLYKERERARENIRRVEAAGYEAICVTVDSSSNGPRDREYRHKPVRDSERFTKYPGRHWNWPTTWDDFSWYRSLTRLPVIPKGIMTAADAERSLELGADGIYISNHGARNLDSGIAPIQVLPAIAEAVAGRVPIIIDGGIRRGTDVLKALALGATAVAVGRPFLYGLAVNGADGVSTVIDMFRNELEMVMISTAQKSIAELDPSAITTAEPTQQESRFFSS